MRLAVASLGAFGGQLAKAGGLLCWLLFAFSIAHGGWSAWPEAPRYIMWQAIGRVIVVGYVIRDLGEPAYVAWQIRARGRLGARGMRNGAIGQFPGKHTIASGRHLMIGQWEVPDNQICCGWPSPVVDAETARP